MPADQPVPEQPTSAPTRPPEGSDERRLAIAEKLLTEAYGQIEHDKDCKKRRAHSFRKAATACTCGTSDWFDRANTFLDELERSRVR